MALSNEEALKQSDELYERYGKPLEAGHWGSSLPLLLMAELCWGRT